MVHELQCAFAISDCGEGLAQKAPVPSLHGQEGSFLVTVIGVPSFFRAFGLLICNKSAARHSFIVLQSSDRRFRFKFRVLRSSDRRFKVLHANYNLKSDSIKIEQLCQ